METEKRALLAQISKSSVRLGLGAGLANQDSVDSINYDKMVKA